MIASFLDSWAERHDFVAISDRGFEHACHGKHQGEYGDADDGAIHDPFVHASAARRGCSLL